MTNAWEQRRVGDIVQIVFRAVELQDDTPYQLVTVKRRNGGVVPRSINKGRDILVKNYQVIEAGDFLISKRQIVHGANGLVPKSLSSSIVSNEYLVIEGNDEITTEFWAVMSRTKLLYEIYFLSSFGVDVEKLVFDVDDWKKRSVMVPSINEQQKVCTFFQRLDTLITLHQRKHSGLACYDFKRTALTKSLFRGVLGSHG